jgi:hypothetical protein
MFFRPKYIFSSESIENKRIPHFSAEHCFFVRKMGERISLVGKMKGHVVSFQLAPNIINMLLAKPI